MGDYEELLQDAYRRILETLPGPRGKFAERAWHAFCLRELIDSWRERYGRRGERLHVEDSLELPDEDASLDRLAWLKDDPPPWHRSIKPNNLEAIERIAAEVLNSIPDEFIRAVAGAAWFKDKRPRLSGRPKQEDDDPSLTSLFPVKSRYQIMRALRHANAQLAAALLADPNLDLGPDLDTLLRKLSAKTTGQSRRAKEKKK